MRTFRCHCGQPLAAVVTGFPGTPLYVSDEAAADLVAAALGRHLPHCPARTDAESGPPTAVARAS